MFRLMQYGGGRTDPHARACVRLWYAANVAAAGLVLVFMGTEHAQSAWWDITDDRCFQWEQTEDEIGKQTLALFAVGAQLFLNYFFLEGGTVISFWQALQ